MLLLRATTDDLEVVTGSAADIEAHVSALIADSASPPALKAIPNLGPAASITTATTTPLVDTSGGTSGDHWNVEEVMLYNNHASQACVVTVQVNDGTNTVVLAKVNLLAGESLVLTEGGVWLHYDSNGGLYPSVGNAASQAEMEAGTATDKYVTPQGVNWHPGACKFWVLAGTTGNNLASWNVTSLTDTAAGVVGVTIATDFSDVNWVCQVSVQRVNNTAAETNGKIASVRSTARATGTVECDCWDCTATTQVNEDPTQWNICGFGDQ